MTTTDDTLTEDIVERLEKAKMLSSYFSWEVGECTVLAWKRIQQGSLPISQETLFATISGIVGKGPKRIYKLMKVYDLMIPNKNKFDTLGFGFFERAFDFEKVTEGEGVLFLEFSRDQLETPLGRRSIEGCAFVFRSQVLGEVVENEYLIEPQDVPMPEYAEAGDNEFSLSNDINLEFPSGEDNGPSVNGVITILLHILKILSKINIPADTIGGDKILEGMALIQEGATELTAEVPV